MVTLMYGILAGKSSGAIYIDASPLGKQNSGLGSLFRRAQVQEGISRIYTNIDTDG